MIKAGDEVTVRNATMLSLEGDFGVYSPGSLVGVVETLPNPIGWAKVRWYNRQGSSSLLAANLKRTWE